MLATVEGVYRGGKVELAEIPRNVPEDTVVFVTFMRSPSVDLRERGIGKKEAEELRSRLLSFSEDWDAPEMDIYDNYESVKENL